MNPKSNMIQVIQALERVASKRNNDYPHIKCEQCENRLVCLTSSFVCVECQKLKKWWVAENFERQEEEYYEVSSL